MAASIAADRPNLEVRRLVRPFVRIGRNLIRRTFNSSSDALRADTLNFLPPDQIPVSSENAIHSQGYHASSGRLFWATVGSLPLDFQEYVFADLGSGRGRVIGMASQLPFRRIEGVEFSQQLHVTAVQQVAGLPPEDSIRVSLHHIDVLDYEFPSENLVIYMYNAFRMPIMDKLADKLLWSHHSNPRNIYIVYCNSLFREVFDERPFPEVGGGWKTSLLNRLAGVPTAIYHLSS